MSKNYFPVSRPKRRAKKMSWPGVIIIELWGKTLEADLPYWIPAWEVVIADPGTM